MSILSSALSRSLSRRVFARFLLGITVVALQSAILQAQTPDRITQTISASETSALAWHHPLWASSANDLGPLPAGKTLNNLVLVFKRSPQQQAALDALIANQQDPASAMYHHWLTPAEMGERFGVSDADLASVRGWLQSQGLQVAWVAPGRTAVGFSGSAAAVGKSFQTEMHSYRVRGRERVSVNSEPRIPAALAEVVVAVRGLFTVEEKPLHSAAPAPRVKPATTGGDGSHYMVPGDFATIYDLPAGLTGKGATIGIVGESRTDMADFASFRTLTSATFPNPTEVIPTAFGGVDPGPAQTTPPAAGVSLEDQLEATLDVFRSGSVAPGANLLLVAASEDSGGIAVDAEYLVGTEPLPAQVMSISFGLCESAAGPSSVAFWDQLFQQAAAEGMSVMVSSGDSGAAGCDDAFTTPPATPAANSPNYICSSSYATCVGGTEFNDTASPSTYWSSSNQSNLSSALSYIPEGAWNEPLDSDQLVVAATGGGVSSVVPTPGWQQGVGVPSARSGRYTPDVSFSASGHDGYLGCFAAGDADCTENLEIFSGTSAAAPGMAGVAALLFEKLGQAPGELNPQLYQMAASVPTAFHDVTVSTSGVTSCTLTTPSMCNNSVPGATLTAGQAGYQVAAGYDEATGLGSLDVAKFISGYIEAPVTKLQFIPLSPCRVVDTRTATGPFGGPELATGESRTFSLPSDTHCTVPSGASAYSLNVTVVPDSALGYLSIWPSGETQPVVSTLNSDGRVKANAAIVPAGTNGAVSVYVSNRSHVILDLDGYFVPANGSTSLQFYPVAPCRVADTRTASGSLGGPSLTAGGTRDFPIQSSSCALPSSAKAYSLNLTAVPHGALGYLTLWPSGQSQPVVSTLNAPTGAVTANAAIVPAGSSGDVSVYASNATDVVIDVNGYFAAPGTDGLSFYTTTPCRVLDTRQTTGSFTGTLPVYVGASACAPPASANAFVMNATVVPSAPLGFLSLWPDGETQPTVSTLNASDAAITSNMAVVKTDNGNIDAYAAGQTQLILDISGYFAP